MIITSKLESVIPAISLVYIAKKYFNKTDAWLYQRINGNMVNSKPAQFSTEERNKLANALKDLSIMLQETSVRLV